ncbi:MAG: hypothetical protein ABH956_01065 [Candidatus Nealsonbacteria bacterium]
MIIIKLLAIIAILFALNQVISPLMTKKTNKPNKKQDCFLVSDQPKTMISSVDKIKTNQEHNEKLFAQEIWTKKYSYGIEKPHNYGNLTDFISTGTSAIVDTTSSPSSVSVRIIPPFN